MADHINPDAALNPHARGHQEDRINIGAIGLFAIGLFVVVVVVFIVIAAMMTRFSQSKQRLDERRPLVFSLEDPDLYPGAHLQEDPGRDMAKMRSEVSQRLEGYGWVDQDSGIAHIPIDRAIQISAEKLQSARSLDNQGTAE
jgi:hypothetical protein